MKWEYRILANTKHIDTQMILNNHGRSGWELVAVSNNIAYLKRPMEIWLDKYDKAIEMMRQSRND